MKIKHLVYAILLLGIGGMIAYRIINNQNQKTEKDREIKNHQQLAA